MGSLIIAEDPDGVVNTVDGNLLGDTKNALSYTILGNGNVPFKLSSTRVDASLGDAQVADLLINDATAFNFEDNTMNSYTITLQVSDGPKTDDVQLIIQVQNSNEAPYLNTGSSIARNLLESSGLGTDISAGGTGDTTAINLLFTDPDLDEFTYSFVAPSDDGTFVINPTTGVVTTAYSVIDHETKGTYTYTIQVTDTLGASSTTPLTITVEDVKEAPDFAGVTDGSIAENSGANTYVSRNLGSPMRFDVSDQDVGDTATVSIQTINGGES